MTFKKGQSGNIAGRPKGITNQIKLRKALEKDLPEVLTVLVEQAKCGDVAAIKLLLDRVLPALKPVDAPVQLTLGADLAASGRSILQAAGAGKITPDEAAKLMSGLGTLARVVETAELVERIEALEAKP